MLVLHVRTGDERDIVQRLTEMQIPAYAPEEHISERRQGEWGEISKILFDGYIFIDKDFIPEMYYDIQQNVPGIIRFLSRDPLAESEADTIRRVCSFADNACRAYIQPDKTIRISGGVLEGLDYRVTYYSKRNRRIRAAVTLAGQEITVTCSAIFLTSNTAEDVG